MARTQNLILRIVTQRGEISSQDLLDVVQKFGRSSDAVRSAATRMVRAGLLTKSGRGRGNLAYRLGPQGQAIVDHFIAKTLRWHMALEGQMAWGGEWLVVTFSVPEGQRSKRDALRSRLSELGFGLLSSSVYISPFDQEGQVVTLVEDLGLSRMVALLHCQRLCMPGAGGARELAGQVWGLDSLGAHYREFNSRIEAWLASLKRINQGEVGGAEALFFQAMDLQGELIDIILVEDPCLPGELRPGDWPGQRTHELLHELTRVADRMREVAGRYDYLFHLIHGMEGMEVFLAEGDDSFHWPSERCEGS